MADTHFSASTSGLSEEAAFHNLVTKTDASGKRRRHKRRRWLQGVLITAAASVAILAGAGTAVMLLRPKMQELELSCQQMMQHQAQLQQHTDRLSEAKQRLQQELASLQQTQDKLQHAKEQLQANVHTLHEHQDKLIDDNEQLKQHVEKLAQRCQDLQLSTQQQQQRLDEAAATVLQQQQLMQQQEQPQPVQTSAVHCAQPGDLRVELTVPGFTDMLVQKVSDANLLPGFAEALVSKVKDSELLPKFIDTFVSRIDTYELLDPHSAGSSVSCMALGIHAGRDAAVLQLTNKHCMERVVTHLYFCLNLGMDAQVHTCYELAMRAMLVVVFAWQKCS
eukprot:jgi/Chrzof1/5971/Cz16g22060.t1